MRLERITVFNVSAMFVSPSGRLRGVLSVQSVSDLPDAVFHVKEVENVQDRNGKPAGERSDPVRLPGLL